MHKDAAERAVIAGDEVLHLTFDVVCWPGGGLVFAYARAKRLSTPTPCPASSRMCSSLVARRRLRVQAVASGLLTL